MFRSGLERCQATIKEEIHKMYSPAKLFNDNCADTAYCFLLHS